MDRITAPGGGMARAKQTAGAMRRCLFVNPDSTFYCGSNPVCDLDSAIDHGANLDEDVASASRIKIIFGSYYSGMA
ncbi:hypothetical protein EVAR_92041_1 [Eumeta japonica]|uniref:Uncharacterized protein n=1 Tax=Eumeta variegata TaxID=151549 RepID=A0A4C1SYX0_EUMVA|nr:hypothetical protein EVAR_92041_1 [Eumeta japonica]